MKRNYCVYILASGRNGTLYTGVTSDLVRRTWEHREDRIDGFTKKYNVHRLVYYEIYEDPLSAIMREKEIKRWRRAWKVQAIMKRNPAWLNLSERLINDLPWH